MVTRLHAGGHRAHRALFTAFWDRLEVTEEQVSGDGDQSPQGEHLTAEPASLTVVLWLDPS